MDPLLIPYHNNNQSHHETPFIIHHNLYENFHHFPKKHVYLSPPHIEPIPRIPTTKISIIIAEEAPGKCLLMAYTNAHTNIGREPSGTKRLLSPGCCLFGDRYVRDVETW